MRFLRLLIIRVDSGVSQLGIGERDQLPGIAGIGHHLLVTGHTRVEDHLTDHAAAGTTGKS